MTEADILAAAVVPPTPLQGRIQLDEYNPEWPRLFAREAARIRAALGAQAVQVEHVGSTSVPGLAAKPVIDLLVGVRTLDDSPAIVAAVTALGYEYIPEFEDELPNRRYFRRFTDGVRTHQVPVCSWSQHHPFRGSSRPPGLGCIPSPGVPAFSRVVGRDHVGF